MEEDLKIPVSISIRKSLKKDVLARGGNISGICSAALQAWIFRQPDRDYFAEKLQEAQEKAGRES